MWKRAGPLEPKLRYAMDFDLWLRFFDFGTTGMSGIYHLNCQFRFADNKWIYDVKRAFCAS
jgi:hypothetical protein